MRKKGFGLVVLFVSVLVLGSAACFAAGDSMDEILKEIQALKQKIAELEKQVEQQKQKVEQDEKVIAAQEKKIDLEEEKFARLSENVLYKDGKTSFSKHDFNVDADVTFVEQAVNNANALGSGSKSRVEGSYQANIVLEKDFTTVNGNALVNLRSGQGSGGDRDTVVYSHVDSNASNDRHFWINKIWYEQLLFAGKLILNFGKLDPTDFTDINRLAGSDAMQFLASIFNNNPAIEFPSNSLAVRAAAKPIDQVQVDYVILNGTGDWNDINDHLFNVVQVDFMPKLFDREGHYRLIGWYNNNDHTEWMNPAETGKGTYGLALSFDQDINDILSVFVRYGWENPDVYNPDITATGDNIFSIKQSWGGGVQVRGSIWGAQ